MKQEKRGHTDLNRQMEIVLKTPASFDFFVAIHDFVEQAERHPAFPKLELPTKYSHLRQVYQGIEDAGVRSDKDLGHDRYMVIQDLLRIQQEEVSDSNPLWKKRELLRALSASIYKLLNPDLPEPAKNSIGFAQNSRTI